MDDLTTTIGGHEWTITAMGDREQFEFECKFAFLTGPSAAAGIGALLGSLAKELVTFARAVVADPAWDELPNEDGAPRFDLARLAVAASKMDTTGSQVERAWEAFLTALPNIGAGLLVEAIPQLTDRAVDHEHLMRLFELAVLGRVFVDVAGEPKRVTTYKILADFTRGNPRTKWLLLAAAFAHNYLPAKTIDEAEGA